jgi:two-component system response regulator AtoC
MKPIIMVIDDETDMLENYRRLLTARGWDCIAFEDPLKALDYLKSEKVEFIITDLRMPRMDGVEVIKRARQIDPESMVVVVTAYGSVESAVAAVKEGAFDYLPKPFTGDQLALVIERGLKECRITRENVLLKRRLESQEASLGFDGSSPAMQKLREKILRVAPTDAGVFVVGESGTGKELVARSLHAESQRNQGPFVPVDCVALPRDLIEGELFGHEKGAYTSADAPRVGLFECADGGTLFLDEISELDINLQAKLLRVLQERQFHRLGGRRLLSIDVRIIAATNQDPQKSVEDGRLREDLLYRLDVVRITVPPLRERAADVPELLERFLEQFSVSRDEPPRRFSREAQQIMKDYTWPGNVRELRNVVEQAVLFAKSDEITVADLPAHLAELSPPESALTPGDGMDYKTARKNWISEFERRYFQSALERNEGNITKAAEEAGVDRKTLYRIIKEHRLL